LAEHMHGIPQPLRPSAQLIETLARAVHVAHAGGVIHRDLKPANILLDGRPPNDSAGLSATANRKLAAPKITDFGLAKCAGGDRAGSDWGVPTVTGEILGTPNYMPPNRRWPRASRLARPPTSMPWGPSSMSSSPAVLPSWGRRRWLPSCKPSTTTRYP